MTAIRMEAVFDRFLGTTRELRMIEDLLHSIAPQWAAGLHVRTASGRRISAEGPSSLAEASLHEATARGPVYAALMEQDGTPPSERVRGSVEWRGSSGTLVIEVMLDESIFAPIAGARIPGNYVALQVRGKRVEGVLANGWVRQSFNTMCEDTRPAWASASTTEEYRTKVLRDGSATEARDFSSHLPGIFWLNFFGPNYCQSSGKARILTAPAETKELGGGVVISLHEDPAAWDTAEYKERERRVLDHIGRDHFYRNGTHRTQAG